MPTSRAPAKINLTLEVLGRRPDGYHDIASVISTIDLCDELTLDPAPSWSISIDAPAPLKGELESGDNLVARAVAEFALAVAVERGAAPAGSAAVWPPPLACGPAAHLHLTKRIPAAAGLGGGSSDAAAALRLLNEFWQGRGAGEIDAPATAERLNPIAARIGSDVPFFLDGGVQLVQGRGDGRQRLGAPAARWLVVLTPPHVIENKTARLYRQITAAHYTDGTRSRALAERLSAPSPDMIGDTACWNVFEQVAPLVFDQIDSYRRRLTALTGAPAHLSGAGPSLFALCPNSETARRAASRLTSEGLQAWAVRTPR